MKRLTLWTMMACALVLAGCQRPESATNPYNRLTPNAGTRQYIITNDKPFARQVARHNEIGEQRGDW